MGCKNTKVNEVAVEKVAAVEEVAAVAKSLEEVAAVEEVAASRIQELYRVHDARKRAEALRVIDEAARLKVLRRIIFEQKIAIIFNQKVLKAKVLAALTEYGAIPWDIDCC